MISVICVVSTIAFAILLNQWVAVLYEKLRSRVGSQPVSQASFPRVSRNSRTIFAFTCPCAGRILASCRRATTVGCIRPFAVY